ncbi:MAG: hypothetical protein ACTHK1_02795 [Actinomycetales bacterium]
MRLISPVDGKPMTDSAWLSVDRVYRVLSVAATPEGSVQLQVVTDDGRSLGWFESAMFMTTDGAIPPNWVARIGDRGAVELAPARWLVPGFWESFYDLDPGARRVFEEELAAITSC